MKNKKNSLMNKSSEYLNAVFNRNDNIDFDLTLDNIDSTRNQIKLNIVSDAAQPWIFNMGCIKTHIDTLLLSVGAQGPTPESFLASKFHFLMRQLRFAISESKRHMDQIRLLEWQRDHLCNVNYFSPYFWANKIKNVINFTNNDHRLSEINRQLDHERVDLFNRLHRVRAFMIVAEKLIEMNDGKDFTDEQYQAEQSDYYTWFTRQKLAHAIIARKLGLNNEGLVEAHQNLARPSLIEDMSKPIDPAFKMGIINDGGKTSMDIFVDETLFLNSENGGLHLSQLSEVIDYYNNQNKLSKPNDKVITYTVEGSTIKSSEEKDGVLEEY